MAADLNAYQGNAELGYGTKGSGAGDLGTFTAKISVDAADKLAYYDFQEQKDKWDRANKLKDEDAAKASELLNFSYGDFLEQDRKKIDDAVAQFTKAYSDDPTAVTLRLGADGKATNAQAHANLYGLKRTVADTIKRANLRSSQNQALNGQLKELKGDETKLAEYQTWHKQELTKSFDQDINLYPDIDVLDLNDYIGKAAISEVKFDVPKIGGNNNEVETHSISNIQSLRSQFSTDYMTKPILAKAFDSKYDTFMKVLSEAIDPNTQKLDMNRLANSSGGQNLLQLQNDANSFIHDWNRPEVLKASGESSLKSVNLEDGLDHEEFFTMLGAYKLKKVDSVKLDYTGNAARMAEIAERDRASKRSAEATSAGKAIPNELGEKVYRDVFGVIQQAGDANGFKDISLSQTLRTGFGRSRGETVKRESFPDGDAGDAAFETAVQKNIEYPYRVIAKNLNGKLQVRAFYEDDAEKTRVVEEGEGKNKVKKTIHGYTEFDENDLVQNLSRQYNGGKQADADMQVATYRNTTWPGVRTPTVDHIRSTFTNPTAEAGAAGAGAPAPAARPTVTAEIKAKTPAGAKSYLVDGATGKITGYVGSDGKKYRF